MKTTVEISDSLLREARKLAAQENLTLRDLIERGLRREIAQKKQTKPFKLRRATFKGKGRRAGLRDASWEEIRDLAYQNRGG